jgi:hypothetical protein
MLVLSAAFASARITVEREKDTWLPLLATPLTAAEILGGKVRASARGSFSPLISVGVLLVLGAACGSLHPAGALVVALDLPVALWASVALGTWLAVRNQTTTSASTGSALVSMLFLFVHGPLVMLALASIDEAREFATWRPIVQATCIIALVAIPLATAAMAWSVSLRTARHFDEWVGRPTRPVDNRASGSLPSPRPSSAPTPRELIASTAPE